MSQNNATSLGEQFDPKSPEQAHYNQSQRDPKLHPQVSNFTSTSTPTATAGESVGIWQKLKTAIAVVSFILSWVLVAQSTPTEQGRLKDHKRQTVKREWAETIQLRPRVASIIMACSALCLVLIAWIIRLLTNVWP